MSATQNMVPADDKESFGAGVIGKMMTTGDKGLNNWLKILTQIEKKFVGIEKSVNKAFKTMGAGPGATSGTPGSQTLGLGQMPNRPQEPLTTGQTVARIGLGVVAVGAGLASMAPSTMAAVNQRMAADTTAGLSGMSSRALIKQSNRLAGGGLTSASGATMASMNILYKGGFTANSLSSKSIMQSIGGLSAISGGTNEQVAGALAGMNGANFLRMGVNIRDSQGNLKPTATIINDVWRFMYGSRKVTKEQAAMVYNPGSKANFDVRTISGGDENLFNVIASGLVARASKGGSLSKKDLSSASTSLDIMGVDKSSPIRANFKNNAAQARLLQATEKGLVGGYDAALNTNAALTDKFAGLAESAQGVTDALMGLKGFLQTFPSTGGVGGGISSVVGAVGGAALNAGMMSKFMSRGVGGPLIMPPGIAAPPTSLLGPNGMPLIANAAKAPVGLLGPSGAPLAAAGAEAALPAAAAAGVAKRAGMFSRFAKMGATGKLSVGTIAAMLGTMGLDKLFGNKVGAKNRARGLGAAGVGSMALTGAAIGSMFGPGIGTGVGAVLGTGLGLAQNWSSLFGGGQGGESGATQMSGTQKAGLAASKLMPPLAGALKITSDFGNRYDPVAKKNGKKASLKHHSGVDYAAASGTPVMAAAGGTVEEVKYDTTDYGYHVVINHGTIKTLYGHLSKIFVRVGQTVNAGDKIALSGQTGNVTGPHLHFEVRTGKTSRSAQDPKGFLSGVRSFFGKVVNKVKSIFSNVDETLATSDPLASFNYGFKGKDASSISSPALSTLLSKASNSGDPLSYDDLLTAKGKSNLTSFTDTYVDPKTGKKTISTDAIDSKITAASGDKGGMAFGSRKNFMSALYRHGFRGKALDTAFAVALAESGGRTSAMGDINLQTAKWGPSVGPFQIRSLKKWQAYHDPYRDASRLINPDFNIESAYIKSKHGTNWKPWSTFQNGAFAKFLDDAAKAGKLAGLPSYDVGTSRVPKDQLALVHKDEMIVTAKDANKIRNGSNIASGGAVSINVDMKVNIANADINQTEHLLSEFKKRIGEELRLKNMGTF